MALTLERDLSPNELEAWIIEDQKKLEDYQDSFEEFMRLTVGTQLVSRCRVAGKDTTMCTICQDEFEEGDTLGVLECGHEYHCQCIERWLAMNNVCPLCKSTATGVDLGQFLHDFVQFV